MINGRPVGWERRRRRRRQRLSRASVAGERVCSRAAEPPTDRCDFQLNHVQCLHLLIGGLFAGGGGGGRAAAAGGRGARPRELSGFRRRSRSPRFRRLEALLAAAREGEIGMQIQIRTQAPERPLRLRRAQSASGKAGGRAGESAQVWWA